MKRKRLNEKGSKEKRVKVNNIIKENKKLKFSISYFDSLKNEAFLYFESAKNNLKNFNLKTKRCAYFSEEQNELKTILKDQENKFKNIFSKVKSKGIKLNKDQEENEKELKLLKPNLTQCGICFNFLLEEGDFFNRKCNCKLKKERNLSKYICWDCIQKICKEKEVCLENAKCPFCKAKMYGFDKDSKEPPYKVGEFFVLI